MKETLTDRMLHAAAHCEGMYDLLDEASALREGAAEIERLRADYEKLKSLAEANARLGELLDEDHWAECERLLLKACVDAKRLDFLDGNLRMKMGWNVGAAPAGNLSVSSVIQPSGPTSIRAAIDAAMAKTHNAKVTEPERSEGPVD